MKRLILDVSDCAKSPLLAESRCGRRMRAPKNFENKLLIYSKFRPHERSFVHELTEEYFSDKQSLAALEVSVDDEALTPAPRVEEMDLQPLTYQARCARRWWENFSNWFGMEA